MKKLLYITGILLILINSHYAFSQLSVSINSSNTAANDCSRTLTAQVQNGSGSYAYVWSITTPGIPFPGANNLPTANLALSQTVDILVTVTDLSTNLIAQDNTTVHRVLLSNFNLFIPNFITPNGDGYNDEWVVTDSGGGTSTINAYAFSVTIKNSNNSTVFQDSGTISTNHLGLLGGDIHWNARINGTGNIVPAGVYAYSLTLVNCSQSHTYNGQMVVVL